ncbi:MAG: chemotaxis-specific protein-glutamate methyltransferase CheB [Pseudobdellovibrionaceae bacterium]
MSAVFYKPDVSHEYQVVFENKLFVCVHGPISYAWLIDQAEISTQKLAALFEAVSPYIVKSPKEYECKVVGPENLTQSGLNVLHELGFNNIKEVVRSGTISICYFPSTGKIFLKKELNHEAVSSLLEFKPKLRVMVIDDSKAIRDLLAKALDDNPELELVASASHPSEAEFLIETKKPDVIAVDLHMPGMDGITLLKKIGPKYRIPIVMISSINLDDGRLVLKALEAGAVDHIPKPSTKDVMTLAPQIIEKLKGAAKVNLDAMRAVQLTGSLKIPPTSFDPNKMILLGAGIGGLEVLRSILIRLPNEIPPILVVQHSPQVFSKSFAQLMDELCSFSVEEATDNHAVKPNTVIVAPGGMQMSLIKVAGQYRTRIEDLPHLNRQKPSIDFLFNSAADLLGTNAVAAVLTGPGNDGAKGLLKMKTAGASTLVQSIKTSILSSMPQNAIDIGAADYICSVEEFPQMLVKSIANKKTNAA